MQIMQFLNIYVAAGTYIQIACLHVCKHKCVLTSDGHMARPNVAASDFAGCPEDCD
jgi:hypothetical protein